MARFQSMCQYACSTTQKDILAKEANKLGFHIYYRMGQSGIQQPFLVHLPCLMQTSCVITVFIEFIWDNSRSGTILLADAREEKTSYCRIDMSDTYKFTRISGSRTEPLPIKQQSIRPPGFHVVQYIFVKGDIEVRIDGVSLVSSATRKEDPNPYIVFSSGPLNDSHAVVATPIIFYEVHQTMDDPSASINTTLNAGLPSLYWKKSFVHQALPISIGGYIFFSGDWPPRSDLRRLQVVRSNAILKSFTAPESGKLAIVVKSYGPFFTISETGNMGKSGIEVITDSLYISDIWLSSSDKILEYRAATGAQP